MLEFTQLTFKNLNLIHQWFQNPETKKWYARDDDWSLDKIKKKYAPRLEGKEDVPSFIVHLDDKPIGFIQYYPFSDSALPEGVTPDKAKTLGIDYQRSVGIDLFIGEESLIGQGMGALIMLEFIETHLPKQFQDIYVDPDKNNIRAHKSYFKVGFHVDQRFDNKAYLIMFLKRTHLKVQLLTQRLILREPYYQEADKIVYFLKTNKQFNQPYEPIRSEEYYTTEYWQDRILNRDTKTFDQRGLQLFLYLKNDQTKTIGYINFDNVIRGCFQSCTLGYTLEQTVQGKGYMTEALTAGIEHVFSNMNLHRIQANYIKDNQKSAKLLEKLGFKQEGIAKDYLYINGKWQDHVLTSLINKNWEML